MICLPHFPEQAVQFGVRRGHNVVRSALAVLFYPLDERVVPLGAAVDPMPLENGVESFLRIRLNYVLLMLHQFDNVLQVLEIAEALAHRLRLGVEANELADDASQELIPDLGDQLPVLRGSVQVVLVRRPRRGRALDFHQGLIQVKVALLVIFVEERRQNYLAML